jgi:hypothetical protein
VKMGVLEIPKLDVGIAPEHTLSEMRDLVEAVHVELSDEGGKVLMLEPLAKNFARKSFMI